MLPVSEVQRSRERLQLNFKDPQLRAVTVSKVHPGLKLCSHCIISKKMGMVAFLSSGSGTSVTSRMGPTMAGMNFILLGPGGAANITTGEISEPKQ